MDKMSTESGGIIMADPSVMWLILDMKKMYIGGATNEQLCGRAKEIHDRLEVDRALAGKDKTKLAIVEAEQKALDKIVEQITKGRDHSSRKDKAMGDYEDYKKKRKKK